MTSLENVGDAHKKSKVLIQRLSYAVDGLTVRCRHLERLVEKQRVAMEDRLSKSQAELTYAQKQLEFVVVNFEREHGIVADHTEQLRLLANQAARWRNLHNSDQGKTSLLRELANWLYTPVVNFVKGIYTLLSPFINTVQSLSIMNSDVLQRHAEVKIRSRWGEATKGNLINLLRTGALDHAHST